MKKTNKKLASAIVLGLMLAVPVGASADTLIVDENSAKVYEDDLKVIAEGNAVEKPFITPDEDKFLTGIEVYPAADTVFSGKNIEVNVNDTGDAGTGSAYGIFAPNGNMTLGTDNTEKINIIVKSENNSADGITMLSTKPNNNYSKNILVDSAEENIVVGGKELNIVAEGAKYSSGIYLVGANKNIQINSENTSITVVSGTNNGIGISATSNSSVEVNGNLEVHADIALEMNGNNAQVDINKTKDKTIKLTGDIVNSNKTKEGGLTLNLSNSESYLNGNIENGSGTVNLGISNGAQWNTDANSHVTALTFDGGIINMQGSGQKIDIDELNGTGVVNTNSLDNTMTISDATDATDASLTVNGSGNIADAIYKGDATAQELADVVKVDGGNTAADKVTTDEGIIAGRYSFDVNADGKVDTANGSYTKNTKNEAISNMASISLMAWRAENNDMNKRLGELRNSKGEHGVWARMVRGESEYGAQSIKNVYNTYQLGYDEKLSTNDHWTVGAAISYTDGQSSFDNGSGENTSKGLSFYGSYLGDNGEFVDLIAKYARLDNEFDVAGGVGSGDYSTNGYSFSAEYGKRTQLANDFYIEPQVELTYGRVADVDFVTDSGAKVSQDSMDSLVGRVGFAAGKNIKNGNVYVRASYLYDFDGETNVTFSNAGASESFSEDLGGGWFEFGIGTNINLSDATYLYFDVEKTTGGEVDTNWQWNAGVRYSF